MVLFQCFLVASFVFVASADLDPEGYLTRFGYYNKFAFTNNNLSDAIKAYQRFHHLNETGVIDKDTKHEMELPRCGLPDRLYIQNFYRLHRWRKTSLTYAFRNYGQDLPWNIIRSVVRDAFNMWSNVTPLKFSLVGGTVADITIGFERYSHGDNSPFDGPGRVLAHAYFPESGRLCFDEDEYWVNRQQGTDLLEIATHEIGHILGLEHSNIRGTIMFPSFLRYRANLQLHSDDRRRIQALYGPGTGCNDGVTDCYKNLNQCDEWGQWGDYTRKHCKSSCKIC